MSDAITYAAIGAGLLALGVAAIIWLRSRQPGGGDIESAMRAEARFSREEAARQARELREEISSLQGKAHDTLVKTVALLGDDQRQRLDSVALAISQSATAARNELETIRQAFEGVRAMLEQRLKGMSDEQRKHLSEMMAALKSLEAVHQSEQGKARDTLDQKFRQIQESNEKRLDEMRRTVDEKLQTTLEKRLGESFKLVGERLDAVHRGLGEMQNLATGVGDLKRVLGNVKERGTWGEYQLGALLEDVLTPEQYSRNVRTREGRESVEFAVRLPGRGEDGEQPVWLPIDAKFPKEAYERLLDASREADSEGVQAAATELRKTVLRMAKDIQEKYINPPVSTDFAILFLPTEGLFAEVLRQPGLHDEAQQRHRVVVAGPTTLSAILNSLRVGFQTLAIEKRASEVWKVLGAVKTEFGKFGDVLDKVKRQVQTVSNTLDESSRRTRAMERKLHVVEQLPSENAVAVLELDSGERLEVKPSNEAETDD